MDFLDPATLAESPTKALFISPGKLSRGCDFRIFSLKKIFQQKY